GATDARAVRDVAGVDAAVVGVDRDLNLTLRRLVILVVHLSADERAFFTLDRAANDADVAVDARALLELHRAAHHADVADDAAAFFDLHRAARDDEIAGDRAAHLRRAAGDRERVDDLVLLDDRARAHHVAIITAHGGDWRRHGRRVGARRRRRRRRRGIT